MIKYALAVDKSFPAQYNKIIGRCVRYLRKQNCTVRVNNRYQTEQLAIRDSGGKCEVFSAFSEDYGAITAGLDNRDEKYYEAIDFVKKYCPEYNSLVRGKQAQLIVVARLMLGINLNEPVDFVVCHTKNGYGIGEMALLIKVAREYNIPVFDSGYYNEYESDDMEEQLKVFIKEQLKKRRV